MSKYLELMKFNNGFQLIDTRGYPHANKFFENEADAVLFVNNNNLHLKTMVTETGNFIYKSNGKYFLVSNAGKVIYPKVIKMTAIDIVERLKKAERQNDDKEASKLLNQGWAYYQNLFAIRILVDTQKQGTEGIIDYSDLELTNARDTLFDRYDRKPVAKKASVVGKPWDFQHYFRIKGDNAKEIAAEFEKNGFNVIIFPSQAQGRTRKDEIQQLKNKYI